MIAPIGSLDGSPPLSQAEGPAKAGTSAEVGEREKLRKAALDFEEVLVRQMLAPLEESLSRSMGGGQGSTPMVSAMVLDQLAAKVNEGGGLGFARVIEEALDRAAGRGREPGGPDKSESRQPITLGGPLLPPKGRVNE